MFWLATKTACPLLVRSHNSKKRLLNKSPYLKDAFGVVPLFFTRIAPCLWCITVTGRIRFWRIHSQMHFPQVFSPLPASEDLSVKNTNGTSSVQCVWFFSCLKLFLVFLRLVLCLGFQWCLANLVRAFDRKRQSELA